MKSRPRKLALARHSPLAACALAVTLLCGGCAATPSHTPSSRELALQREQFVEVSSALSSLSGAVLAEARSARRAWPAISDGLPAELAPRLLSTVAAASSSAAALPVPRFAAEAGKLTGPASGVAGLYESYERLSERGWRLTEAGLATIHGAGAPRAVAFARENSPVYIDAIYDGHFNLSLIGKSLAKGYERLGGPTAFASKLTQQQIDALTRTYSSAGVRLEPHPGKATEEG